MKASHRCVMRVALLIFGLIVPVVAVVSQPANFTLTQSSSRNRSTANEETKLLLISDNQEHLLTGGRLRSMSAAADKALTPVALRSPLANIGGRAMLGEILSFGRSEAADLVIHLGDASDVSCPDELSSVFDLLDKEAEDRWFIAPGNHDGIMAGTFATFQPPFDVAATPIYAFAPRRGYAGIKRTWLNACLSPSAIGDSARANILTKGDAIEMYLRRLKKRAGAVSSTQRTETVEIRRRNRLIPVACKVEEVRIDALGYAATARVCERTRIRRGSQRWVGPSASYIVQKIKVGGSELLLLDTSYYRDPNLKNVAFSGELSREQTETADRLLGSTPRNSVILAGHHPLDDIEKDDRDWMISRGARYLSGHIHRSAQLISHEKGDLATNELNIGSTLDSPVQAVIARVTGATMAFRVAGAPTKETRWPAFLTPCLDAPEWRLTDEFYRDYRRAPYVARILDALAKAGDVYNQKVARHGQSLPVPAGTSPADWLLFEQLLAKIGTSHGRDRTFWACQSYFASEATKKEKSQLERIADRFGFGKKTGRSVLGLDGDKGWYKLENGE